MLVLASTNSALAKTSTMRSMCLSSRCDATKLRPIPPKIQRSKASYVSLSSLWFFFFFVRPLPHPIPKDRQVNDSTLSRPRVNESTQQRSTHSRSMKSNARVNQSRQQSFNATEDHTEPTDFVGLQILGGHVFLLGLHLCLESTIFAVLFFCWIAPVSGMQDFCCLGFF